MKRRNFLKMAGLGPLLALVPAQAQIVKSKFLEIPKVLPEARFVRTGLPELRWKQINWKQVNGQRFDVQTQYLDKEGVWRNY